MMGAKEDAVSIPGPPGYPLIGNITDINPEYSLQSFVQLADKYGSIYQVRFPGTKLIVCSTFDLVDELCDEEKFQKVPTSVLTEIRNGVHDGLFTAHMNEPNWGIAHRVLMPAFGPNGIRDMFDEMHDIASQLVLKWARQGPDHKIHVTDDFTRLALDTLALCSMGFRFNNFYSEKEHRFVTAMGDFLSECGRRSQRLPLPAIFYQKADETYTANIKILRDTADAVLKERIAGHGTDRKDLLMAMLKGRDTKTNQKMSNESIIDNLITFLIAGHETTSGTLSYAMYELLRHPEAYREVQREVDQVIGNGPVTVEHIQKLPYIEAVIRETLRLDSPIPIVSRLPKEDGTVLGGKYIVNKDDACLMLLTKSHLDPEVYDKPTEFRPERMLSEHFNKLPKNAWKPFGNGARAVSNAITLTREVRVENCSLATIPWLTSVLLKCIGRPFAWQELVLALAMLFQNFEFELDDPNYNLHHKQTLTIKPKDLYIRARLREGVTAATMSHYPAAGRVVSADQQLLPATTEQILNGIETADYQPLTILYGSNSGTCELMAQRIASEAPAHGFRIEFRCLDNGIERIAEAQRVVIITPSYEGQPPDNATKFVPWVESIRDTDQLHKVTYSVFGCGNHDWPQTLHRVPKLIDRAMVAAGAQRMADTGLADAASEDVMVAFENWTADTFWPALEAARLPLDSTTVREQQLLPELKARIVSPRPVQLGYDMMEARVVTSFQLTAADEPAKVHVEVEVPSDIKFRAGDYLTVLPVNRQEVVMRVLRRLKLHWDSIVILDGTGTKLPTGVPISAHVILSEFVELGHIATPRQIAALARTSGLSRKDEQNLQLLSTDEYDAQVLAKHVSILDILEQHASIDIGFDQFLRLLPVLRPRQYSISSSHLAKPGSIALTVAVFEAKAHLVTGQYSGVASSYLAQTKTNDLLWVSVKASHDAFHLPANPDRTPIIMISAGSGIAPFRGFIQERAAMQRTGQSLAPALLFHGCRQPGRDDLYVDELSKWESLGVVTVNRAFSRIPEQSGGSKYVQDAVWANRDALLKLWREGAFVYVCGSKTIARAITQLAIMFKMDVAKSKGQDLSEEHARKWWEGLRNVRYAFDVFD